MNALCVQVNVCTLWPARQHTSSSFKFIDSAVPCWLPKRFWQEARYLEPRQEQGSFLLNALVHTPALRRRECSRRLTYRIAKKLTFSFINCIKTLTRRTCPPDLSRALRGGRRTVARWPLGGAVGARERPVRGCPRSLPAAGTRRELGDAFPAGERRRGRALAQRSAAPSLWVLGFYLRRWGLACVRYIPGTLRMSREAVSSQTVFRNVGSLEHTYVGTRALVVKTDLKISQWGFLCQLGLCASELQKGCIQVLWRLALAWFWKTPFWLIQVRVLVFESDHVLQEVRHKEDLIVFPS